MENKKRKGFTLVELLVVIAIIAVLATVSVVGYIGFKDKAKEISDVSLIKQLNTVLVADEVEQEKNATFRDAISDLREGGYDISKLTPTNLKNDIVWEQESNRFVLLDENGNVLYKDSETKAEVENFQYWKIYRELPDVQKYSIYLVHDWPSQLKSNEYTVGFGSEYPLKWARDYVVKAPTRTGVSPDTVKPIIDVMGPSIKITVDDPNADVDIYGNVKEIEVKQAKMSSVHIMGKVTNSLIVRKGNVVLENNAVVSSVVFDGPNVADIKFNVEGKVKVNAITYNKEMPGYETLKNTNKAVVSKIENSSAIVQTDMTPTEINNGKDYGGGMGTVTNPYVINTYDVLKDTCENNIGKSAQYFKLGSDIVMNALKVDVAAKNLTANISINRNINIDLNGHKILRDKDEFNNTITYYACFFAINSAVEVTIKGEGTMDAELGDGHTSYCFFMENQNATLNLLGGNYYANLSVAQVTKGTLNVKGGHYDIGTSMKATPDYRYLINILDANFNTTAKINVTGGTFVEFDPSNNPEGDNTTYVSEGHSVTSKVVNGFTEYTVKAN